jgi:hypothetical protein
MNEYALMLELIIGAVGLGMFMYGKKAGRMVPLGAGAALMVVPYFIPNLWAMAGVCGAIMASPWFVRE